MWQSAEKEPTAKIVIVVLDETEFWTDKEIVAKAGRIYATYVYDENVVTHLCSAEKNYFLRYLYSNALLTQATEEEDERLQNYLDENCGEDNYYSCRHIDGLPAEQRYQHREHVVENDEERDGILEEEWEYLQGNHIFTLPRNWEELYMEVKKK